MGYTHYWKTKNHTPEQWETFVDVCKKLAENLPKRSNTAGGYYSTDVIDIAGGNGEGEPTFNNEMVDFNGRGDDLMHETFRICGDPEFNPSNDFCKTARKPYDLLVVACLIAASQILGYRFCSDGFNSDGTCDDLQPGIDFYNQVVQPNEPITQVILWEQRNKD